MRLRNLTVIMTCWWHAPICVCLVCLRLLGQLKALPGTQNDEQVDLAMELRQCWTLTLRKELRGWCCPKDLNKHSSGETFLPSNPTFPFSYARIALLLSNPVSSHFICVSLPVWLLAKWPLPSLSQQLFSLSSGTHLRPVCSWRSTSMHRSGLPVRALEQLGKFVITQVCKE